MAEVAHIPMFPLSILPIPGELVPLHIFEPRYKQLLQDLETGDITFGIFFNHAINERKIGSLMRLESVLKRYPGGESDIIVRCEENFFMDTLYPNFRSKMYPGGDIQIIPINIRELPGGKLGPLFQAYLNQRNITRHQNFFSIYEIACELNLDLQDRYDFLTLSTDDERQKFLLKRLKFQQFLLDQEEKSRNSFYLN